MLSWVLYEHHHIHPHDISVMWSMCNMLCHRFRRELLTQTLSHPAWSFCFPWGKQTSAKEQRKKILQKIPALVQAFREDSKLSCRVISNPIKNIIHLVTLPSPSVRHSLFLPGSRAHARKQRGIDWAPFACQDGLISFCPQNCAHDVIVTFSTFWARRSGFLA